MARGRAWGACGLTQSQHASAKGKAPVGTIASVDEDNTLQITSSAAPPANTTRKPIQWEKAHSAHTSRLIAWCRDNEDSRIKLFLDSVKDAKDQGRKKKQSGIPKVQFGQWLWVQNSWFKPHMMTTRDDLTALISI